MIGPIFVVVVVDFVLSIFLPSIDLAVGSYDVQLGRILALALAGYAGGLRFALRQSRRMRLGEKIFCTIVSYLLVTLLPLLLFSGLIFLARDMPELAELMTEARDPSALLTFVFAYVLLDALPHTMALFLGLSASQMGAKHD